MNAAQPVCVWPAAATLGEGAVWDAAGRAVYFVDIKGHALYRFLPDSGQRQRWDTPGQTGFALPCADGSLICGVQGGLHRFDPATGQFALVLPVERDRPGNRLNDGYVDAGGALWFGSMDDAEAGASGALYRVARDGTLAVHDSAYVITNGPAISPDGRTLYHNDTLERAIYAFDLDLDTRGGETRLANRRVFARIEGSGYPDGLAVDRDGYVWVALFGGARIERRGPDGSLAGSVSFPCANVTKLTFAGDDLRTVYATTARKGLDAAALAAQPLAGGLFRFEVPVPGLPTSVCTVDFPPLASAVLDGR